MKKLLCLLPLLFVSAPAGDVAPHLVPRPKSLVLGQGALSLPEGARIVADHKDLEPLAKVLADEILLTTGVRLAAASGQGRRGDIVLRLDPELKGEAYTLEVTDASTVTGGNYHSVASGTITLLQSLRVVGGALTLPRMKIADEPAYPYRGALIDLARKYHSPGGIEQVIELCRLYKIRYLHLHLTDDHLFMFPSARFPQLGGSNREFARFEPPSMPRIAPYTLEELRRLEKYASERGVFLVPELDLPGHSGRLIANAGDIFGLPGNGSTVNIASPKTLEAITILMNEVMDVFQSTPYIHLGADEVGLGGLADFRTRLAHTDRILDRLVHPIVIEAKAEFIGDENSFTGPLTITLVPRIEGHTIRYTLDNSMPNERWMARPTTWKAIGTVAPLRSGCRSIWDPCSRSTSSTSSPIGMAAVTTN